MIKVSRETKETKINIELNLYGKGKANIDTGVGFLDHMLDQVARHSLMDINIKCVGDTNIDDHHSVEDIGITLGQAFNKSIGDKKGLTRYGCSYVPLDESLSRVVVDLSGRPCLVLNVTFVRAMIGKFDVDLVREFFQGFVNHALIGLHIDNLRGINAHHQAETIFKAFGRAIKMSITIDHQQKDIIPSTKGVL
jgi:imidazoleglycerol-phosphate dehydratase